MKVITLILICSLLFDCTQSSTGQKNEAEQPETGLDLYTDSLWGEVKRSENGFDTSKYFQFILNACHYGYDQDYITTALQKINNIQIKDGENLGKIPRYIGHDLKDKNNIEFALEFATPTLIEYYKDFNKENRVLFNDFIDCALYASWNHDNVAVTYSNIYLMRTWIMIGLGENLPSERTWGRSLNLTAGQIAAKGYEMLDKFYSRLVQWGIHEHNSPTYTGVQAECLGFLAKYTKNVDAKDKAQKCLDYFSALLFSNYFTPARALSGPMSRCYNRGFPSGLIDKMTKGLIYGEEMIWYEKMASWVPSERDRRLNSTYPRLVAYTFGEVIQTDEDGRDFYAMNGMNYVEKKYSIGSAGHHYTGNGTEKTMCILVATEKNNAIVNFSHYMEGRNDPYGRVNYGSHAWTCFRDAYARSQHDNEFVFIQAGNGRDNPPGASNLVSHVIVPGTNVDEIWIGNDRVHDWFNMPRDSMALNNLSGNTIFFRIEDIVVSFRYLYTFGTEGADKPHYLVNDGCKFSVGQALQIATILKDSTPSPEELGGLVMWWRVDKDIDSDDKFTVLRNNIISAPVFAPDQRTYGPGDSLECYVITPEGLKLGIKGIFRKEKYYNRWIFSDENPEYLIEEYWHFNQLEAYGSSIDFSDRKQAYFSINGLNILELSK